MTLCKLTRVLPAGATIYINPAHVIAVDTHGGHTVIITTGAGKGGPEHFAVMETLVHAAEALDLAALE